MRGCARGPRATCDPIRRVGEGLPPSFCAAMVTPAAVSAAAAALRWLALATEAVGRCVRVELPCRTHAMRSKAGWS